MSGPTRTRKLAFSALAALLVLVALEGLARVVELGWFDPDAQPSPSPEAQVSFSRFASRQAAAQRALAVALGDDHGASWTLSLDDPEARRNAFPQLNDQGLRQGSVGPRRPGELRLLTLGDSSVYGVGVGADQAFGAVAARAYATRTGRPATALNGGIPGADTERALVQLGAIGRTQHPEVVVIAALWSDLYARGSAGWIDAEHRVAPLRHLALWRLGRTALAPWLGPRTIGWIDAPADIGTATTARTPLDRYRRNLDQLAAQATALGARPVFLVLPAPIDFGAAPLPEGVAEFRGAMADAANAAHATLVDGPRWFRDRGAGIGHFFDQVHPNAAGHALLGEALDAALPAP